MLSHFQELAEPQSGRGRVKEEHTTLPPDDNFDGSGRPFYPRSGKYKTTRDVTVRVQAPTARYLDELFSLRCCGDIAHLFPNSKEVTESFAMYAAVRRVLGYSALQDPDVLCLVPGDGTKPRTAAVFAFRSRWTVWSIDPRMGRKYALNKYGWLRMRSMRLTVEKMPSVAVQDGGRVVVVACHSHAPLKDLLRKIPAGWEERGIRVDVFSMPCCKRDGLGPPDHRWRDGDVWTPKNEIKVWLAVKEEEIP